MTQKTWIDGRTKINFVIKAPTELFYNLVKEKCGVEGLAELTRNLDTVRGDEIFFFHPSSYYRWEAEDGNLLFATYLYYGIPSANLVLGGAVVGSRAELRGAG